MDSKRALHFAYTVVGSAFLRYFPLSALHGSIEPVALVVFSFLPVFVDTMDEIEHM
jgi:hypothetical protein